MSVRLQDPVERDPDRHIDLLYERVEKSSVASEALALLIRFWLTTTAAVPRQRGRCGASQGQERSRGFHQAIARRIAEGHSVTREILEELSTQTNDDFLSNADQP
jgi:hypothetical protein